MVFGSSIFTVALAITSVLSVTQAQRCPSDADKPWSFDYSLPNGPQHWGETYTDCCVCNNKQQSPINIISADAQQSDDTTGLQLTNYDMPLKEALFNNTGYFLVVQPTDGVERSITVDGASIPLKSIIVRVGNVTDIDAQTPRATPGSDHRVDSQQFAAELQFVHVKGDQQVIASSFFDQSFTPSITIQQIFTPQVLRNIQYKGNTYTANITNDQARLDYLLPPGASYFSYKGSASVPPCTPGIQWLIKKGRLNLDIGELLSLQGVHSVEKGDPNVDQCFIVNNFRQPQPLNARTVTSVGQPLNGKRRRG